MKIIYHSHKELSRCSHCNRHNQVKKEDLLHATCEFCQQPLISKIEDQSRKSTPQATDYAFTSHGLGTFGQKLLVGLVGATMSLSACEQEEVEVVKVDQAVAQPVYGEPVGDYLLQQSDEFLAQPEYGAPVGDFTVVTPADEFLAQPEYGAPVGDFEVISADQSMAQPVYGEPIGDFLIPSADQGTQNSDMGINESSDMSMGKK